MQLVLNGPNSTSPRTTGRKIKKAGSCVATRTRALWLPLAFCERKEKKITHRVVVRTMRPKISDLATIMTEVVVTGQPPLT
jgi:hypothetical protein